MDLHKQNLKGSPSRDAFKLNHKKLSRSFYSCDIDFVWVEKFPEPDIVAVLDYKAAGDEVTFTEVIAYNAMLKRGLSVYIVWGDAESGAFTIYEWLGGHHERPDKRARKVHETADWQGFEEWQRQVRYDSTSRFAKPN